MMQQKEKVFGRLTLPLPESVNHLHRIGIGKRGGKPRLYKTPEAKNWTANSRWLAREQLGAPFDPLDGPVAVELRFINSPLDSDNGEKLLYDMLEGVAYHNDKQVREHHVYMDDLPCEGSYVIVRWWALTIAGGTHEQQNTHR